jgi:hypothetical protein
MPIQKEDIEAKVSHKDILDHFLKPYYGGQPIKPGVLISNPFLARKQQTPSFNVYYKGGNWRWKDFIGDDGSCYDLVMRLYDVKFPEALEIINQEMNLNLEPQEEIKVYTKKPITKPEPVYVSEQNYNYDVDYLKWTPELLRFWNLYGIKQEHLERYNVKPIKSFFAYSKLNEPYLVESTQYNPIYGYLNDGWIKIYRPYSEMMKFLYLGEKPEYFVFGMSQLPEKGSNLFLVGGEKDVITMHAHKMNAVALNSEESSPINYPNLLELLKSGRFKNYWIMYDNDETGIRQMDKITEEFPIFKKKQVPDMVNGTDISDYYKNKYANRL